MVAIEQGKDIDDPNLYFIDTEHQWFKSRADLWATFKNNEYCRGVGDDDFEAMCNNTLEIAERSSGLDPDTSIKIPDWKVIDGTEADRELKLLVAKSLKKKGLDKITKKYVVDGREVTYVEQAKIECERFIYKGFASYFLITADLLGYGKDKGYPFGPRGSAGGSLVCYLLGIHAIDPLKWELSFDRFMSPSRGGYLLKVRM
jgi:DNA polymerase-3 subunit alpha